MILIDSLKYQIKTHYIIQFHLHSEDIIINIKSYIIIKI